MPLHLRIPIIAHGTIQDWLKRATFPTAWIGGFLVGLCTFPCSGGIYMAIVGLLDMPSASHDFGRVYEQWDVTHIFAVQDTGGADEQRHSAGPACRPDGDL